MDLAACKWHCGGLVNHWARRPLPRLDSEQFRSDPRTCGRFRRILRLR
jgi:hypothetical protein